MEEENRHQKLKAGKEKLAQFQRKKKKKKPSGQDDGQRMETGGQAGARWDTSADDSVQTAESVFSHFCDTLEGATEAGASEFQLSASVKSNQRDQNIKTSDVSSTNDNQTSNEDPWNIQSIQTINEPVVISKFSKSQHGNQSTLASNQSEHAALDTVSVAKQSNQSLPQVGNQSLPISDQSGLMLPGAENQQFDMADMKDLLCQVQWLQTQLRQSSSKVQSQNDQQKVTFKALQNAKGEISTLQNSILEKDELMSKLAEKVTQISTEYGALRGNYAKLKDSKVTSDNVNENNHVASELGSEKNEVVGDQIFKEQFQKQGTVPDKSDDEIRILNEEHEQVLRTLKDKFEKIISEILAEKEKVVSENKEMKRTVDEVMSQNASLTEQCEFLTKGSNFIKEEHKKSLAELAERSTSLRELGAVHDKLIIEKSEANKHVELLELELKRRGDEKHLLTKQVSDLENQIKQLKDELTESATSRENLEASNEVMKIDNVVLAGEIEKMKKDIVLLYDENTKLNEEIDNYKLQVTDYEEKVNETEALAEENHSLRLQNDESNNKINDQKDVIASLKTELEALTQEKLQMAGHIDVLDSDSHTAEKQNIQLHFEIDQYVTKISDLETELCRISLENIDYKDKLDRFDTNMDNFRQPVAENVIKSELVPLTASVQNSVEGKVESHSLEVKEELVKANVASCNETVIGPSKTEQNKHELDSIPSVKLDNNVRLQNICSENALSEMQKDAKIEALESEVEILTSLMLEIKAQNVNNVVSDVNRMLDNEKDAKIAALERDVENIRSQMLATTAEKLVNTVVSSAQTFVETESNQQSENSCVDDGHFEKSVQSAINDTAYESLHCESVAGANHLETNGDSGEVRLRQILENMQVELNTAWEELRYSHEECQKYKEEIQTLKKASETNSSEALHGYSVELPASAESTDQVHSCLFGNNQTGESRVTKSKIINAINPEVSPVPSSSGALDKEVNLHASSSPSCHGNHVVATLASSSLGNVVDGVTGDSVVVHVGIVDEDAFQNSVEDNSIETRCVDTAQESKPGVLSTKENQSEISSKQTSENVMSVPKVTGASAYTMPDVLVENEPDEQNESTVKSFERSEAMQSGDITNLPQNQIETLFEELKNLRDVNIKLEHENSEMLKRMASARVSEEGLRDALTFEREANKKLKKDGDNSIVAMDQLQKTLDLNRDETETVKSEKQDLLYEMEKLTWERDAYEQKLSQVEHEVLEIKTAKCDMEFEKEKFHEELNRVKERLEYLESCDSDALEIKDMLEVIQEERESAVKENEKLQCSFSAQLEENEKLLGTMDALHKENSVLLENLQRTTRENEELKNESLVSTKRKLELENEVEAMMKEKQIEETRFSGEIEGLLEENSTLKTNIQIKDSEIEQQKLEINRLNSFFPNIDHVTDDVNIITTKNAELEKKIADISNDNENLVAELMDFQMKLSGANDENEVLLNKCEEYQTIVNDLDDEKTLLLESIDRMKNDLDAKRQDRNALIEKYEMQFESLDQENSTLKTKVMVHEDESKMKQELEKENSIIIQENIENKAKIEALEIELLDQMNEFEEKMTEKISVSQELEKHANDLTRENTELIEKFANMEHDLIEVKQNEKYVMEQLKVYEESQTMEQDNSANIELLMGQLELEKKYKVKFQNDLEQAHVKMALLETANRNFEEEMVKKERQLSECQANFDKQELDLKKLKGELIKANNEKEKLKANQQETHQIMAEKEKENKALKEEIDKMGTNLQFVSCNRDHVRTQVELLAAEVERLSNTCDDITLQCNEKDLINRRLQMDCKSLKDEVKTVNSEKEAVVKENQLMNSDIEMMRDEVENMQIELDEIRSEKGNAEVFKSEVDSLLKERGELKKEIEDLKKENKELHEASDEMTGTLLDMHIKYENVSSTMEAGKKKTDKEIYYLQSQLKEMNDDVSDLRKVLDFMEGEMHSSAKEKLQLKECLDELQIQVTEVEEHNQRLEELLEAKHQKDEAKQQNDLKKQQKDLKNIRQQQNVVAQHTANTSTAVGNNGIHEPANVDEIDNSIEVEDSTIDSDTVTQLADAISAMSETLSNLNETYELHEEHESPVTTSIIPSFESAFHMLELRAEDECVSSKSVQTNLSVGEFESTGFLLDDNGDAGFENSKDLCMVNNESQTESFGIVGDIDDRSISEPEERSKIHSATQTDSETEECVQTVSVYCETKAHEVKDTTMQTSLVETTEAHMQTDAKIVNNTNLTDEQRIKEDTAKVESFIHKIGSTQTEENEEAKPVLRDMPVQTMSSRMLDLSKQSQTEGTAMALLHACDSIQDDYAEEETSVPLSDLLKCVTSVQTEDDLKCDSCQEVVKEVRVVSENIERKQLKVDTKFREREPSKEWYNEIDDSLVSDNCTGNISAISADSGILSAAAMLDDRTLYRFDTAEQFEEIEVVEKVECAIEHVLSCEDRKQMGENEAESDQGIEYKSDKTTVCEVEVQTDIDFDQEIDKLVKQREDEIRNEFDEKMIDLENNIENSVLKKFDFRELKIKGLEDNYEQKVKQMEYEIEEIYEQKFRQREVEVVIEAERDKKAHADKVNRDAQRRIERVKMEKDQQFVETLQKVKADFAKRSRHESGGEIRRAVSYDTVGHAGSLQMGPQGDKGAEPTGLQIHQLKVENEELASARDDLLHKIDVSEQEQEVLHQQLLCIMGERGTMGNGARQPRNQQEPSWLDWEMSPELSFGSVRSSLDPKSLSGSLDPSAFCSNSDCLSVRMKYEQLIDKIAQFLKIKAVSNEQTANDSGAVVNTGEFAKKPIHKKEDGDRFVEHDEPETQMLQRITSIHLEHFVRVPKQDEAGETLNDQFVHEVTEGNCVNENNPLPVNDDLVDMIVSENVENVEGHFSENDPDDDDDQEKPVSQSPKQGRHKRGRKYAKRRGRSSASFDDDGHFSEEEEGTMKMVGLKRRHFSDSDIKRENNKEQNVDTSKSDNVEGEFVFERSDSQIDVPDGITQSTDSASDDNFDESVFTEELQHETLAISLSGKDLKMLGDERSENNKFINENLNLDEKPPGTEEIMIHVTAKPKIGEESGDFFEENNAHSTAVRHKPAEGRKRTKTEGDTEENFPVATKSRSKSADRKNSGCEFGAEKENIKEQFDSGDILESIAHDIPVRTIVMEKYDSFVEEKGKVDSVQELSVQNKTIVNEAFVEDSASFVEENASIVTLERADFCDEALLASSQSPRRDLVNTSPALEADLSDNPGKFDTGQQSYENAVFDILNSICPGTDPKRRPGSRAPTADTFHPVVQELKKTADDFSDLPVATDLKELSEKYEDMKVTVDEVLKENAELKDKLDSAEGVITELEEVKEKYAILEEENACFHEKSYIPDSKSLTNEIEKLKNENADMKKKLQEIDIEQFEQTKRANEEMKKEINMLNDDIKFVTEEVELKTKELSVMHQKMGNSDDQEQVLNNITELNLRKNVIEEKLQTECQNNEYLKNKVEITENLLSSAEASNTILKEEVSKLAAENVVLKEVKEKYDTVSENQNEMKAQIEKMHAERNELEEVLEIEQRKATAERQELEKALLAHDELNKQLESKLEEMEVESKELDIQLKEEKETKLSESKSKEDLKGVITELQIEKDELSSKIATLKKDNEALLVDETRQREIILDLKSEKDTLNKELKLLKDNALESEKVVEDSRKKISDLNETNQNLESLVGELTGKVQSLEPVIHEMENEIEQLQLKTLSLKDTETKLESAKLKNESLENEKVSFLQSINQCERKVEELNCDVEKQNAVNSKLVERNKENEWALKELESQIKDLKEQMEIERKEMSTITDLQATAGLTSVHNLENQLLPLEEEHSKSLSVMKVSDSIDKATETEDIKECSQALNVRVESFVQFKQNKEVQENWLKYGNEMSVDGDGDIDIGSSYSISEIRHEFLDGEELVSLKEELEMVRTENVALKERIDSIDARSDSDTDLQILQDMREAIKSLKSEKAAIVRQQSEVTDTHEKDNRRLQTEIEEILAENDALKKKMKVQEQRLKKENTDILEMYNDLRNEVEILVISKHDLEVELHALKDLLEQESYFNQEKSIEHDTSKELTVQDLEEMAGLKTSIEKLKFDLKEKDSYVRKLEEHLLGSGRGAPNMASTPKPQLSRGHPLLSKHFLKRASSTVHGRRRAFSDISSVPEQTDGAVGNIHSLDLPMHKEDLEQSSSSERQFVAGIGKPELGLTSSMQSLNSTLQASTSFRDSMDVSERIRSGLKADEDGHLALELKQFELVAEITKLRRDLRETKAVYAQETSLLTEALENERVLKEVRGRSESFSNISSNISHDLLKLRKEVALLKEENKLLKIENDRWLERLKEQEAIVSDLKERIGRNTSGYGEIEEVFGRQLALLQKQREELIDKIKNKDSQFSTISMELGEKGIIEESLRKEKNMLMAKLEDQEKVEKELNEKKVLLEKQILLQRELEDVIYRKDMNEIDLMKQKRILEEELREIESKFRDKEENLDYEKNRLLGELREENTRTRTMFSESDDDVSSVCSDGAIVSDRKIGRLEIMLEQVERQHSVAVNILKDQLQTKYSRREKELRKEHRDGIKKHKHDTNRQVN